MAHFHEKSIFEVATAFGKKASLCFPNLVVWRVIVSAIVSWKVIFLSQDSFEMPPILKSLN